MTLLHSKPDKKALLKSLQEDYPKINQKIEVLKIYIQAAFLIRISTIFLPII